jgi:ABC-type glycerol-3-phosphate transport system substrate-binding protein
MTFKTMIFLTLSGLALAGCDTGATSTSSNYDKHVLVVNDSSLTVTNFYGSNAGADTWQEDILGDGTLASGSSININFEDGSGYCTFDFKAVFSDGTSAVQTGIDVCSTSQVTIH